MIHTQIDISNWKCDKKDLAILDKSLYFFSLLEDINMRTLAQKKPIRIVMPVFWVIY